MSPQTSQSEPEMTTVAAAPPPKVSVRRVTQGTLANILSVFISMAGHFVLTPVFLMHWGVGLYGEWLTLSAAVAYMALLDFGMQTYVVNRLTQCYALGELDDYTRILHSGLMLSLGLTATGAVIVVPFLFAMPVERWFRFTYTGHSTAALVAVLLTVQVLASIPHGLFTGIYRSIGEYPRSQMINNARLLATFGATLLVLLAGGQLVLLAGVQFAMLAAVTVFVLLDIRKRHPEIHIGLSKARKAEALSFLLPSSLFLVIQLAGALTVQGSTLVVGALFGAASVTLFVSLRTLANIIRQGTNAVLYAVSPEINSLEAQQHFSTLQNLHSFTAKILLLVSLLGAVFLHFAGAGIVQIWTQGRIEYNTALMNGVLLLLVSQGYWLTSSYVLGATNNHRTVAACSVASGAIGLSLGVLLASRFGLTGFAYGLFLADLVISGLFLPLAACRLIGQSVATFKSQVLLRCLAGMLPVYGIAYGLSRMLPPGSTSPQIFLTAAAVLITGVFFGYTIALNEGERIQIQRFFSKMLPLSWAGASKPE
jgi:O-antigen/teichoic acid export membrane protein